MKYLLILFSIFTSHLLFAQVLNTNPDNISITTGSAYALAGQYYTNASIYVNGKRVFSSKLFVGDLKATASAKKEIEESLNRLILQAKKENKQLRYDILAANKVRAKHDILKATDLDKFLSISDKNIEVKVSCEDKIEAARIILIKKSSDEAKVKELNALINGVDNSKASTTSTKSNGSK